MKYVIEIAYLKHEIIIQIALIQIAMLTLKLN